MHPKMETINSNNYKYQLEYLKANVPQTALHAGSFVLEWFIC